MSTLLIPGEDLVRTDQIWKKSNGQPAGSQEIPRKNGYHLKSTRIDLESQFSRKQAITKWKATSDRPGKLSWAASSVSLGDVTITGVRSSGSGVEDVGGRISNRPDAD